jgi:hypothetical protein
MNLPLAATKTRQVTDWKSKNRPLERCGSWATTSISRDALAPGFYDEPRIHAACANPNG